MKDLKTLFSDSKKNIGFLVSHIAHAYRSTYTKFQIPFVHVKPLKKLKYAIVVFFYYLDQPPCNCGCYETDDVDHSYMDHTLMEYSIVCRNCRRFLGNYAYGYIDGMWTYSELWDMRLDELIDKYFHRPLWYAETTYDYLIRRFLQ